MTKSLFSSLSPDDGKGDCDTRDTAKTVFLNDNVRWTQEALVTDHLMRYRRRFGVEFTRWNPGWTIRVWRLSLNWHVLTVWRWGVRRDLAHLRRGSAHLGKRLMTWSVRRRG